MTNLIIKQPKQTIAKPFKIAIEQAILNNIQQKLSH